MGWGGNCKGEGEWGKGGKRSLPQHSPPPPSPNHPHHHHHHKARGQGGGWQGGCCVCPCLSCCQPVCKGGTPGRHRHRPGACLPSLSQKFLLPGTGIKQEAPGSWGQAWGRGRGTQNPSPQQHKAGKRVWVGPSWGTRPVLSGQGITGVMAGPEGQPVLSTVGVGV